MNQILQSPLPLAPENPFSEQECIDHIGAHAHHSSFAAGAPDQLRRNGVGALGLPSRIPSSRYSAVRPDVQYQPGTVLSDSGSGSISASPSSSASSSLPFTSFSPTTSSISSYNYGIANNLSSASFPYSFGPMSTRRMSSITDSSSMLPPARSPMGNPVSPSMGVSARDNYTTSTPGLHRHPHTALSPRHNELSRYSTLSDTPRSVVPTTMSIGQPTGYPVNHAMYAHGANVERNEGTPPFNAQENYYEITCEGTPVVPEIHAKIEKGFFWSTDRVWTCYRRNYFSVSIYYQLNHCVPNGRLYLNHGGSKQPEQIQSMAVSLAAAIDDTTGKAIELIQHTPKRDKGPQLPMNKEPLAPTPPGKTHDHGYSLNSFNSHAAAAGPQLPLQNEAESSHAYSPTSHSNSNYQHSFERIQFKSATANNGKRRAQQQYYHLIVELWANVQSPRDNESQPRWVKIAAKSSHPVVVRGRSPSHYQNEGPHNPGAARGNGGPSVGGGGPPGLGSAGGSVYRTGYGNGLSGSAGSAMGGSMYRGGTSYSLDPSPVNSHSVSSASSLSGGHVDGLVGDHHMGDDDDTKMVDGPEGYQYFPAPLYDSISSKIEGHGHPLPDRRVIKEEFPGPAAITSGWQVGGCGRFQGLETSRGYYPDVHAHAGY